jgi:hypothetical protein
MVAKLLKSIFMGRKHIKKRRLSTISFFLPALWFLFPFAEAEAIEWGLFQDVVVEGYVLVGENSVPEAEDGGLHRKSPGALYRVITGAVPLAGARIRLEDGEASVTTDEDGFFAFTKTFWFFQDQALHLEVVTPLKTLKVAFNPGKDQNPFLAALVDRDGKGAVYSRDGGETASPVAFVSLGLFNVFSGGKEGDWSRTATLFESDPLSSKFECHLIKLNEVFDFMNIPSYIHNRISTLHRVYGQSVRCAGFGLGGLALRHYSVSKFYPPGSMECLLQVAPPNKGMAFPEPLDKALSERRARLVSQLDPESDFMRALNRRETDDQSGMARFSLDPERMNADGFNPEIRTLIVAGDVIDQSKEALKSTGEAVGKSAGAFLEFWKNFLSSRDLDPEFLEDLEEAGRQLLAYYEQRVESLPEGDLVVPLDRALVEGVASKVLPYGHFSLLAAESLEDERYRTIRDFLIK